jgi:hypothetical protein
MDMLQWNRTTHLLAMNLSIDHGIREGANFDEPVTVSARMRPALAKKPRVVPAGPRGRRRPVADAGYGRPVIPADDSRTTRAR